MANNYGYDSQPVNWSVPGLLNFGNTQMPGAPQNLWSPEIAQPDMASYLSPRALLDGTNGFGANSAPNPFDINFGGNTIPSYDTGNGGASGKGFWGSMIGDKENPGWGGMALGAASGLASAFMGMKQYGLAKDTLAQNKQQFQMQYDAQKSMTNSSLEDRQRARIASNPGAYQSPGDYMSKYGVK